MRRLLPLVLTAALAPLAGASASSCAEPIDEPATCCPPRYLVEVDNGTVYLAVPDPTWSPAECSRIV